MQPAVPPAPGSVDILGVGVSIFRSYRDAIDMALQRIRARQKTFCVAINPEKVLSAWSDEGLRALLNEAEMRICDGVGTAMAARMLHGTTVGRVTGIQLFLSLVEAAAENGLGVYLLGASAESNEGAARTLRGRHAALRIVGTHDGYFNDDAAVIQTINAAGADMLFVAMGSPRQEQWIQKHRRQIDAPFCMGVGGSLDVVSGRVRWAPAIFRRTGTEFLYRLACEPSRWKRQARLPLFLLRVARHSIANLSSRFKRARSQAKGMAQDLARPPKAELSILPDSVVKKVEGIAGDDEALITQAAHDLGARCGLYYVPKVLRRDAGVIELERITAPTPLSKVTARELETDLLARAGAALAHVHQHLQVPAGVKCRDELNWPYHPPDRVPLHGDFNTTNVCRDGAGRLVILDWSSAPALGGRRLYGSRYFDIAHFVVTLAAHRRNVVEAMRRFPAQARIFMDAYSAESGLDLDLDEARAYVLKVSELLGRRPAPSGRLYATYYRVRRMLVHRALEAATAQWVTERRRDRVPDRVQP